MFPLHIQGNTDLNIFQKEKAQYSEKKPSAPFQFAFRTIDQAPIADFFQPNIPSVWSSLFGEVTVVSILAGHNGKWNQFNGPNPGHENYSNTR